PIAEHDGGRWRASREEAEHLRVLCDPHHFWIDLEECPLLALMAVTGETARAGTNHGDPVKRAVQPTGRFNRLRNRAAKIVVSRRLRSSKNGGSGRVAHAHGAMDRGAVE